MGFQREEVSAEELREYVLAYAGPKIEELRRKRHLKESFARLEGRMMQEVQGVVEKIRQGNTAQLQQIEANLMQKHSQLIQERKQLEGPERHEKSLSPVISFTDCIRHHDPTDEFPQGRPGPTRCVATSAGKNGVSMRCLVAYYSHQTDDKGFARLPYQIFHETLLRQGNCPRPLSRSISRRIPALSWLFVKPEVCPLADGKEHVIED